MSLPEKYLIRNYCIAFHKHAEYCIHWWVFLNVVISEYTLNKLSQVRLSGYCMENNKSQHVCVPF